MTGVKYLSLLIKGFRGDLKKALAYYNSGPTVVETCNAVPPFPETIKCIEGVLANISPNKM